jgi:hypothetical protein
MSTLIVSDRTFRRTQMRSVEGHRINRFGWPLQ